MWPPEHDLCVCGLHCLMPVAVPSHHWLPLVAGGLLFHSSAAHRATCLAPCLLQEHL